MKPRKSAMAWMLLLFARSLLAQEAAPPNPALLGATFGRLPLYFVENRGVYADEVAYYVQGADKTLFFTKEGITFRLKGKDRGWVVKLEFEGANQDVMPRGVDKQRAVFSYFRGPRKDWKAGLRTYSSVVYRDLWPGIDLVYKGTVNHLKYEFLVAPGADPGNIRLRYRGATEIEVTTSGGLRVGTPMGSLQDEPPVAWQDIAGDRVPVKTAFQLSDPPLEGGHEFGFRVADYDQTIPLFLDPALLVYCGYVGGSGAESGDGIAVDAAGNAYVTGAAGSTERTFPVKVGPSLSHRGSNDAFVAKVNAAGTALLYCGYIGGSGDDYGVAIGVDAAGDAYITGRTTSNEQTFPVAVGPDLTHNGGLDAFAAKVNAQGTALVYCGYIGGSHFDWGSGIAVDAGGNAYVTGFTGSNEQTFPVKGGPDLSHNGGVFDAFVAKVSAQGTALTYCGYIGGNLDEIGSGIAVDAGGNAYVTGNTGSNEQTFPVKVGPDLTYNGNSSVAVDAYVAKVNAQGTALVYCGYIGGSGIDSACGIALDSGGNAYVTGQTTSNEQTFPVRVGPDLTYNDMGYYDAFVAKVNAQGTSLVYCGYIGGIASDVGSGIAVDAGGNAFVAGTTFAREQTFPVVVGPDLTHNGDMDAFVAMVNARGTALVYCGYLGGSGNDWGYGIAVDAAGNAYVTGMACSNEQTFPVVIGPDLTHNGGYTDAFVGKVALTRLTAGGAPRPQGTITFTVSSTDDAALPYQFGTSLGTGPIKIDTRQIDLSPDALLLVSTSGYWPWIFSGYRGVIDSKGQARATIHIPNVAALIGVRLHSAFVTVDPTAPSGIRSISNSFAFSVTK